MADGRGFAKKSRRKSGDEYAGFVGKHARRQQGRPVSPRRRAVFRRVAAPTRRRITPGLICSSQMAFEKPLVFISCGQYSDAEKRLGKDICSLLASSRPDVNPYFAEDQSTVEGLSNQVLKALHQAAGFICIMHRRGDLMVPEGGK